MQPPFGCGPNNFSPELIRNDRAAYVRHTGCFAKNTDGKRGVDREIEGIAKGYVIAPFVVRPKISKAGLDFGDDNAARLLEAYHIRAAAICQRKFA